MHLRIRKIMESIKTVDFFIFATTFSIFFFVLKPFSNEGSMLIKILILLLIVVINVTSSFFYKKYRNKN